MSSSDSKSGVEERSTLIGADLQIGLFLDFFKVTYAKCPYIILK
jgi:hypothetical protein